MQFVVFADPCGEVPGINLSTTAAQLRVVTTLDSTQPLENSDGKNETQTEIKSGQSVEDICKDLVLGIINQCESVIDNDKINSTLLFTPYANQNDLFTSVNFNSLQLKNSNVNKYDVKKCSSKKEKKESLMQDQENSKNTTNIPKYKTPDNDTSVHTRSAPITRSFKRIKSSDNLINTSQNKDTTIKPKKVGRRAPLRDITNEYYSKLPQDNRDGLVTSVLVTSVLASPQPADPNPNPEKGSNLNNQKVKVI
jgi:hypothetical protein